jgi:hypothetical protein
MTRCATTAVTGTTHEKNGMHRSGSVLRGVVLAALAACVMSAGVARADVTVTVDPATITNGYMNVFNLPADGSGFQFGSGWGIADLTAVYSGSNVTLGPNCIGDPNPYWYIGGGGPGAQGNKIMEANLYAEQNGGGPLTGTTVVFIGNVLSNTLATSHTCVAFIKDFAPDFSSFNLSSVPLPPSGQFKLALATVNDPGRHVQYGFQMVGPCVWVTDLAPYGSVTVGPQDVATSTHSTTWGRLKAMYR